MNKDKIKSSQKPFTFSNKNKEDHTEISEKFE